jgi:hypothetical protein
MGDLFRRCTKRVSVAFPHLPYATGCCRRSERRKTETAENIGPRTSKITAEHEIQYEKAILVILECVAEVHHEGMIDLRKKYQQSGFNETDDT